MIYITDLNFIELLVKLIVKLDTIIDLDEIY